MNGLVYRIDEDVYMSLFSNDDTISDGIPISEGVYLTLKDNEISYVDVSITDGTKPVEIDDVDDFVYNRATQSSGDIFYGIKDISKYSFNASVAEMMDEVGFGEISKDIMEDIKNVNGKSN